MIAASRPAGALPALPRGRGSLFGDRWFLLALIAPVIWAALALGAPELHRLMSRPLPALQFVLLFPLLEEIVFRGGLQPVLARHCAWRWGWIGAANLVASAVFAALHLMTHPSLWALAVFLPSLLFGAFRDRSDALLQPTALHAAYNLGYFVWATPI